MAWCCLSSKHFPASSKSLVHRICSFLTDRKVNISESFLHVDCFQFFFSETTQNSPWSFLMEKIINFPDYLLIQMFEFYFFFSK